MSFLQWAGGKVKTIPHIAPFVPLQIHNYFEPFLGGGSVLIHVLQRIEDGGVELTGKVVAADINPVLIQCFQAIKDDADSVVEALERLCAAYEACPPASSCKKHYCVCCCQECMYHAVRTCFNIYKSAPIVPEVETAAHFLFLNSTCYRGLYRESKAGAFNTCYWTSRPLFPKSDRILNAGYLFRKYDVQFECCHYRDFWERHLVDVTPADVCYIDHPYVKQKPQKEETGRVKKRKDGDSTETADKFSKEDATWIVEWVAANLKSSALIVLFSAYSNDLPNTFEGWPHMKTFSTHRSMTYKGAANMHECIISTVPPPPRNEMVEKVIYEVASDEIHEQDDDA